MRPADREAPVVVSVSGLRKSYGTLAALDGVSFEVRKNCVFGYLGPNGTGKTTTINILCGLLDRDGGKVSIFGRDVTRALAVSRKDIESYYGKPPLVTWGLLFPAVLILAVYLKDRGGYLAMAPGIIGMTLLFGNTSMAAIVITFEKRTGTPDRLPLAPLSPLTHVVELLRIGVQGESAPGPAWIPASVAGLFLLAAYGITVPSFRRFATR